MVELHNFISKFKTSVNAPSALCSILILSNVFQAAVFTRSPDSLESRLLKARGMRTMKDVEAHTVSWVTAEEAMDKRGLVGRQCPQTLAGQMHISDRCRLI